MCVMSVGKLGVISVASFFLHFYETFGNPQDFLGDFLCKYPH